MTASQIKNLISTLKNRKKRELIIRIETTNYQRGVEKAKLMIERMQREMRIQKLEIAVKKMNINRSWS